MSILNCKYGQTEGNTVKCPSACDCHDSTFLESIFFYAIVIGMLSFVCGAIYIAHVMGY